MASFIQRLFVRRQKPKPTEPKNKVYPIPLPHPIPITTHLHAVHTGLTAKAYREHFSSRSTLTRCQRLNGSLSSPHCPQPYSQASTASEEETGDCNGTQPQTFTTLTRMGLSHYLSLGPRLLTTPHEVIDAEDNFIRAWLSFSSVSTPDELHW